MGVGKKGRARGTRMSPSHVFSCAHYFQAPATQARVKVKVKATTISSDALLSELVLYNIDRSSIYESKFITSFSQFRFPQARLGSYSSDRRTVQQVSKVH